MVSLDRVRESNGSFYLTDVSPLHQNLWLTTV